MEQRIGQLTLHYVAHGDGVPLVVLHGAGVDHRETEAAIEAVVEAVVPAGPYRRIYLDLPAMGRSTAEGLTSNDDVVAVLAAFLEQLDAGPALLLGHSYGGYLARGVAARRPDLVRGLALVCPLAERTGEVPDQVVVQQDADAYDELAEDQREGFEGYFVVRTRETARRYRDTVVPGNATADEEALGRIVAAWRVDLGSAAFEGPTLVVAGRRDSTVGYTDAVALLDHYPHATLAIVEDAGHALLHERPALVAPLLEDWLRRGQEQPGPHR